MINKLINWFFPKPKLTKARLKYNAGIQKRKLEGYARIVSDPDIITAPLEDIGVRYGVSSDTVWRAIKYHKVKRTSRSGPTARIIKKATYGSQADEVYKKELRDMLGIGDE